jgi:hypothetical protein
VIRNDAAVPTKRAAAGIGRSLHEGSHLQAGAVDSFFTNSFCQFHGLPRKIAYLDGELKNENFFPYTTHFGWDIND